MMEQSGNSGQQLSHIFTRIRMDIHHYRDCAIKFQLKEVKNYHIIKSKLAKSVLLPLIHSNAIDISNAVNSWYLSGETPTFSIISSPARKTAQE